MERLSGQIEFKPKMIAFINQRGELLTREEPNREFCGYIAANQGFPAGSTRNRAKVRRATVGSNRHPADEMHDIRERMLNSRNAKPNCARY